MKLKKLKLLATILTLLIVSSCETHFGIRRIYSPLIRACNGTVCEVNCFTVMYDFDNAVPVEDWYEIAPGDCSKMHGLSYRTWYEDFEPFLKELKNAER